MKVKNGTASVQALNIEDAPRFAYRGMHLDVVRNFSKKETVLNMIDLMAFYKLNKFHFHITDDEGWRLEIPGLDELTTVGSKRGHSKNETEMLNPAYGSGPYADGEKSFGTGFYTKAEFVEILKYAKLRTSQDHTWSSHVGLELFLLWQRFVLCGRKVLHCRPRLLGTSEDSHRSTRTSLICYV